MAATTRITFPENMRMVTMNLAKGTWAGTAFPYTYTISLTNTTATQMIFVHNAMNLTQAQIEEFGKACITAKSQATNQIVLQAVNKPTIDLPIVIEIGGETITG